MFFIVTVTNRLPPVVNFVTTTRSKKPKTNHKDKLKPICFCPLELITIQKAALCCFILL